jgi:hypothetical protein
MVPLRFVLEVVAEDQHLPTIPPVVMVAEGLAQTQVTQGQLLASQILAVAVAVAAVVPEQLRAAQVLSLFATAAHSAVLAVQSHHLADTPSTHLHRLERIPHKENLNGTFCKSC